MGYVYSSNKLRNIHAFFSCTSNRRPTFVVLRQKYQVQSMQYGASDISVEVVGLEVVGDGIGKYARQPIGHFFANRLG
jgi:hypothetical protein